MKDNKLENMINEYREIEIPDELRSCVEKEIKQAKADAIREEQKKRRFPLWAKTAAGVVAAMVALMILVNVNPSVAYAMSEIPVLGTLIKVVTFSTYERDDKDMHAKVQVPKVEVEEGSQLEQAVQQLNEDMKGYTNQIINQYEEDVKATNGEGYETVATDYEVVTDNEHLFSIRINTVVALNTSGVTIKIYHIDKMTGELISLPNICKRDTDYQKILTDDIMKQMRQRMKEDDSLSYFIDDTDMPELNWTGVTEDANFYFNEENQLVLVFDKYEVAPGYMGVQEFVIPDEVTESIINWD